MHGQTDAENGHCGYSQCGSEVHGSSVVADEYSGFGYQRSEARDRQFRKNLNVIGKVFQGLSFASGNNNGAGATS